MLSDIFRIIPRLCAGYSTMYRLTLLTSPEGNLQTPTLDPKFFYANKGCNSGDLTYKCSIPIHPYFYNLSALIKTIQQLVPCICNTSQLDISNINCYVGILEKREFYSASRIYPIFNPIFYFYFNEFQKNGVSYAQ